MSQRRHPTTPSFSPTESPVYNPESPAIIPPVQVYPPPDIWSPDPESTESPPLLPPVQTRADTSSSEDSSPVYELSSDLSTTRVELTPQITTPSSDVYRRPRQPIDVFSWANDVPPSPLTLPAPDSPTLPPLLPRLPRPKTRMKQIPTKWRHSKHMKSARTGAGGELQSFLPSGPLRTTHGIAYNRFGPVSSSMNQPLPPALLPPGAARPALPEGVSGPPLVQPLTLPQPPRYRARVRYVAAATAVQRMMGPVEVEEDDLIQALGNLTLASSTDLVIPSNTSPQNVLGWDSSTRVAEQYLPTLSPPQQVLVETGFAQAWDNSREWPWELVMQSIPKPRPELNPWMMIQLTEIKLYESGGPRLEVTLDALDALYTNLHKAAHTHLLSTLRQKDEVDTANMIFEYRNLYDGVRTTCARVLLDLGVVLTPIQRYDKPPINDPRTWPPGVRLDASELKDQLWNIVGTCLRHVVDTMTKHQELHIGDDGVQRISERHRNAITVLFNAVHSNVNVLSTDWLYQPDQFAAPTLEVQQQQQEEPPVMMTVFEGVVHAGLASDTLPGWRLKSEKMLNYVRHHYKLGPFTHRTTQGALSWSDFDRGCREIFMAEQKASATGVYWANQAAQRKLSCQQILRLIDAFPQKRQQYIDTLLDNYVRRDPRLQTRANELRRAFTENAPLLSATEPAAQDTAAAAATYEPISDVWMSENAQTALSEYTEQVGTRWMDEREEFKRHVFAHHGLQFDRNGELELIPAPAAAAAAAGVLQEPGQATRTPNLGSAKLLKEPSEAERWENIKVATQRATRTREEAELDTAFFEAIRDMWRWAYEMITAAAAAVDPDIRAIQPWGLDSFQTLLLAQTLLKGSTLFKWLMNLGRQLLLHSGGGEQEEEQEARKISTDQCLTELMLYSALS